MEHDPRRWGDINYPNPIAALETRQAKLEQRQDDLHQFVMGEGDDSIVSRLTRIESGVGSAMTVTGWLKDWKFHITILGFLLAFAAWMWKIDQTTSSTQDNTKALRQEVSAIEARDGVVKP